MFIICFVSSDRCDVQPFIDAMRPLFWRHSKQHVQDELDLPPQHIIEIPLTFSDIERVNYVKQIQGLKGISDIFATCVVDLRQLIHVIMRM
jgi:hypothetical protein